METYGVRMQRTNIFDENIKVCRDVQVEGQGGNLKTGQEKEWAYTLDFGKILKEMCK